MANDDTRDKTVEEVIRDTEDIPQKPGKTSEERIQKLERPRPWPNPPSEDDTDTSSGG